MTPLLQVVDLGHQPYRPVLEFQREMLRARIAGTVTEDILLLVEHDPVVTLGRSTQAASLPLSRPELEARGFVVEEVERGGDVTVHAPGQLVGYPILDLNRHRLDLHWYLRQIEAALIAALAAEGVLADRNPGYTGVWAGPRKIASIGVHVKQWVTLHGFALNVTTDLRHFDVVVPCGIQGVTMTSLQRELGAGSPPAAALWERARDSVISAFGHAFERAPATLPLDRLPPLPSVGNLQPLRGVGQA
ncbi:MAG: lipoyl(octanoyl) transferase LipB [Gemmatimonadota bacterium]|nr:lipoyl(octanoyl) transferase LipB [Gemmatimonadota bacterium]